MDFIWHSIWFCSKNIFSYILDLCAPALHPKLHIPSTHTNNNKSAHPHSESPSWPEPLCFSPLLFKSYDKGAFYTCYGRLLCFEHNLYTYGAWSSTFIIGLKSTLSTKLKVFSWVANECKNIKDKVLGHLTLMYDVHYRLIMWVDDQGP